MNEDKESGLLTGYVREILVRGENLLLGRRRAYLAGALITGYAFSF
jgi:hypothetical protein